MQGSAEEPRLFDRPKSLGSSIGREWGVIGAGIDFVGSGISGLTVVPGESPSRIYGWFVTAAAVPEAPVVTVPIDTEAF